MSLPACRLGAAKIRAWAFFICGITLCIVTILRCDLMTMGKRHRRNRQVAETDREMTRRALNPISMQIMAVFGPTDKKKYLSGKEITDKLYELLTICQINGSYVLKIYVTRDYFLIFLT